MSRFPKKKVLKTLGFRGFFLFVRGLSSVLTSVLTLFGEISGQCVGHADLACHIQMGVDIGGHLDVRVPHPLLRILEGEALDN